MIPGLCETGIEACITSDVVLKMLGIPQSGLLRISAALLFASNNELCAYWWRDSYDGQQHAELRDPVQVQNAFSRATIDSGYLPANTIRLGMSNSVQWLAISIPPASYHLTLLDEQQQPQSITIGLPGCILAGRNNAYWLWAVKDTIITSQTPLFHMPLPNIGSNGRLCFGTNPAPKAEGPTIMQAFHLFIESPFNDHWAAGKARSHADDVRAFLHTIAGQEQAVFPEEELVPIVEKSRRELTLDTLLNLVAKGGPQ